MSSRVSRRPDSAMTRCAGPPRHDKWKDGDFGRRLFWGVRPRSDMAYREGGDPKRWRFCGAVRLACCARCATMSPSSTRRGTEPCNAIDFTPYAVPRAAGIARKRGIRCRAAVCLSTDRPDLRRCAQTRRESRHGMARMTAMTAMAVVTGAGSETRDACGAYACSGAPCHGGRRGMP